jgi:hypothetical protein
MSQKCTKCEINKPLSNFYIRKDNGNYRKDCKECMSKVKNINRQKNIENNNKLEKVDKTQTKDCSICFETKTLNEFSICKATANGFYSWCKICSRKKYKEQVKTQLQYKESDIKRCNKCSKSKNIINFRLKHSSDGYSNICLECDKEYRKSISKELYQKKKLKLDTNIQFKLSENIRSRIRNILGNIKIKKPNTVKLLGCSLDSFINHLQKYFYDNITLDNYGKKWHLDHIIPCDWFDLTDITQLKACTHYTNLQPLLIKDNLIKSNRLDWVHPKTDYQITFLRLVYNKFLTCPNLK